MQRTYINLEPKINFHLNILNAVQIQLQWDNDSKSCRKDFPNNKILKLLNDGLSTALNEERVLFGLGGALSYITDITDIIK